MDQSVQSIPPLKEQFFFDKIPQHLLQLLIEPSSCNLQTLSIKLELYVPQQKYCKASPLLKALLSSFIHEFKSLIEPYLMEFTKFRYERKQVNNRINSYIYKKNAEPSESSKLKSEYTD